MIAFTLQNDLNRLYPFLLEKNAVIHSQNKSFGSKPKAHFFSNFFSFETQRCGLIFKKVRLKFETKQIRKNCALSSEQNDFMQIIEAKKVLLEFELHVFEF